MHGVDVDPNFIVGCQQHMGFGNYATVPPIPPVDILSNSYDIIFAYSVFSHLSEEAATEWIKAFQRILKPGGLVFATTQRRSFIEFTRRLKETPNDGNRWHVLSRKAFPDPLQAVQQYDAGQFVFAATGGANIAPKPFTVKRLFPKHT